MKTQILVLLDCGVRKTKTDGMLLDPIGLPVVGFFGAIFQIDWRRWGGAQMEEKRGDPASCHPHLRWEVGILISDRCPTSISTFFIKEEGLKLVWVIMTV
jgi:hypothetical protein